MSGRRVGTAGGCSRRRACAEPERAKGAPRIVAEAIAMALGALTMTGVLPGALATLWEAARLQWGDWVVWAPCLALAVAGLSRLARL